MYITNGFKWEQSLVVIIIIIIIIIIINELAISWSARVAKS